MGVHGLHKIPNRIYPLKRTSIHQRLSRSLPEEASLALEHNSIFTTACACDLTMRLFLSTSNRDLHKYQSILMAKLQLLHFLHVGTSQASHFAIPHQGSLNQYRNRPQSELQRISALLHGPTSMSQQL